MRDPMTLVGSWGPFELWHVDPCKGPGGDDSCGWFKRAHHGDAKVLKKIESDFKFDWDRIHKGSDGTEYWRGYFVPHARMVDGGDPVMSVQATALGLFWRAALAHFQAKHGNERGYVKANRFMQKNLWGILHFAENPFDSLRDSIVQTWGKERRREDRIHSMACCIYGWILREEQRWWQHARWHVWHWKLQVRWNWRLPLPDRRRV